MSKEEVPECSTLLDSVIVLGDDPVLVHIDDRGFDEFELVRAQGP